MNQEPAAPQPITFTNGTLIATPSGDVLIEKIENGSMVMAADSIAPLTWRPAKVAWRDGSAPTTIPSAVYIDFEDDSRSSLICELNQPFLLYNGKLTLASNLYRGRQLMDRNGNPRTIASVSVGRFNGTIIDFLTDKPWDNSPEGHLVLANGVVCGDMQVRFQYDSIIPQWKEE